LVHLYCLQTRPKKVISETYVSGKPSSLLGPFLSTKRKVGMYKQCRINNDRLYAHANEFCCLTLRSLCCCEWEEAGIWQLALWEEKLCWMCVWKLKPELSCAYWSRASVFGGNGPCPPPTITVTWDLPCSWGKYRKPYQV